MRQLQLFEIERTCSKQPSPEERYDKIWSELSNLQEPARKRTKLWKEYQTKKDQLLAELAEAEREMEDGQS